MNLLPKRMGGIGIAFCAWATFVAVPLYSQRENVKLRRLELDLSGDASIEYDDNLNTIGQSTIGDIIITTGLNLGAHWKISEINSLRLNLDLSYKKYLENPEFDSIHNFIQISPDSEFAFNIRASNLTVKFFDFLSFSSNSSDSVGYDPQADEVILDRPIYARFQNTAGVEAKLGVKQGEFEFKYERFNLMPLDEEYAHSDRTQNSFTAFGMVSLSARTAAGIQGSYFTNAYEESFRSKSEGTSIGSLFRWNPSDFTSFNFNFKWTQIEFNNRTIVRDISKVSTPEYSFSFNHTPRDNFEHSVNFSRIIQYGSLSNSTIYTGLGYSFRLDILKETMLRGGLNYRKGKDSGAYLVRISTAIVSTWRSIEGLDLT